MKKNYLTTKKENRVVELTFNFITGIETVITAPRTVIRFKGQNILIRYDYDNNHVDEILYSRKSDAKYLINSIKEAIKDYYNLNKITRLEISCEVNEQNEVIKDKLLFYINNKIVDEKIIYQIEDK